MLAEQVARYPDPEGYVFGAPDGGPLWRRSNFSRRIFQPAVERAGLNREGLTPLRIHDLRHTSASLAIEAGAHPKSIQALLGHSSITTTLDRYGHLLPGMDEALAERMDEVGRSASTFGSGLLS